MPAAAVGGQAAQTQPEDTRGQIGKALALGQDEEAAVVDDQAQTARALTRTPAKPRFARLEMKRCGAESDEGNPLTVELGHVAQRLAQQQGLMQIMFFLEQPVKLGPLVNEEQADADAFEEIGFRTKGCKNQCGQGCGREGRSSVISHVPHPCLHSVPVGESALY